jgi:hypothetical protein
MKNERRKIKKMSELEGEVLYTGTYVGYDSGVGYQTMWKVYVQRDDTDETETIHGDWRPMREFIDNVPLQTKVAIISHPDSFLPMIQVLEEF